MVNLVPIPNSLSTSMVPSCASIITFAIQHNCTSYRLAYRINPSSPITAALNYARQNRKQPVGLESTITLIHTLHQKIRGSGGLKSPTKIPRNCSLVVLYLTTKIGGKRLSFSQIWSNHIIPFMYKKTPENLDFPGFVNL